VFNWALAEWKAQSEAGGKPNATALKKQFNAIRREQFPWSYEVTKCAVEGAFMDVAAAFQNFFERRKGGRSVGYPKFKSKKRSQQSFYLANDKFTVGDHWIEVPKLGLLRLATLSDGRRYENQRPLRHLLKKLRRLNKELARRTKGGKNWQKTRSKLGRLHYRIACLRADLLHKLTTEVSKTSGLVAVEDLHVKGLIQNRCLSRAFSDAALGKLLDLLESKVPRAGGRLVKVGRSYPSRQLCHRCGSHRADLTLEERIYVCQNPTCGYVGDRDENASHNIVQQALRLVGP